MKIAVYNVDGKVFSVEATKENLAEKVREAALGDSSEIDWKRIQLFVDGRPLPSEELEAFVSRDLPENTVVVVVRLSLITGSLQSLSEPITVYLREVNGKTLKVTAFPTQTISALKTELTSKLNLATANWSLFFKGNPLTQDSDLLLQHHILNKSIVHVIKQDTAEEIDMKFINQSTTEREEIKFHLKSDESIGSIRSQLGERLNINPQKLLLVYCGGELLDGKTVADYHITSEAGVFLIVKEGNLSVLACELAQYGTTIKRTTSEKQEEASPKRVLTYDEPEAISEQQPIREKEQPTEEEVTVVEDKKIPTVMIPTTNSLIMQENEQDLQSPVAALLNLERDVSQESNKGSNDSPGFSPLVPDNYDMRRKSNVQSEGGSYQQGTAVVRNPLGENVEGVDQSGQISDSVEIQRHHNPLADARIIEDKGCEVKQVESIIISEPAQYRLMQVKHVESLIERSEDNSQAESFLDDQAAGNSRITQSMRQKSSVDKKLSPVYTSSIETQQVQSTSSTKLYKNVLSESIELEPKRIVLRRSNGVCCSDVVTPMETVAQLKKRLEGHHGIPAASMTILLGGKVLADDCTFVQLRLQQEEEFELQLTQ